VLVARKLINYFCEIKIFPLVTTEIFYKSVFRELFMMADFVGGLDKRSHVQHGITAAAAQAVRQGEGCRRT